MPGARAGERRYNMKKQLCILLAAFLAAALFCACSGKQPAEPVPAVSAAPDVTAAPDDSENDLAATDKPCVTVDTSYNPETDAINLFSAANACLIETEDGFYWCSSTSDYLLFYDNWLEEMIPVCSRPECEHFPDNNVGVQNKDCDAYLEAARHPALYNGKIYYIDSNGIPNPNVDGTRLGMRLFRMNPDGTGKEFIKNLFTPGYEEPQWLVFHRGYIYGMSPQTIIEQGEVSGRTSIIAIPIEGEETTFKTIYEIDNQGWGCMRFIGDYCYFWIHYMEGYYYINWDTGEEIDEQQMGGVALRWNTVTEEIEILYQELLPKDGYFGETAWFEEDGTVYVPGGDCLMKIENGERTVVFEFKEEGKNFVAATVSNGIVFARTVPEDFNDPYGKSEFWVRRFDGTTVFKGELPMDGFYESPEFEGLRGKPRWPGFVMTVGDETGLWIEFGAHWRSTGYNEPSADFLVRYDFTEDGGIEYKLYGSYDDIFIEPVD